jgi:ribosomal protein L19E
MDKTERVAEMIYKKADPRACTSGDIQSILEDEYGNERNAALEEAARVCRDQAARWQRECMRAQCRAKGRAQARVEMGMSCAAAIRALKSDLTQHVSLPRKIAEALRDYLRCGEKTETGSLAEADGMDEELSALNKALKEKP